MTCRRCQGTGREDVTSRRLYENFPTVAEYCQCENGWELKRQEIEQAQADEIERLAKFQRDEDSRWRVPAIWDDMASAHGVPCLSSITVRELRKAKE